MLFCRSALSPRLGRAFASSVPKPFKVLGVQQIALGGLNKLNFGALWVEEFGLPRIGTYQREEENVNGDILLLGTGPWAVEVELMQPLDPSKSPKVHKTPLHHIGLWVDHLPAAVEYLTSLGMRFTPGGIRHGTTGYSMTFVHPKGSKEAPLSGEGVLIELVQAPTEAELAEKAKKYESYKRSSEGRPFNILGLQQVAIGGLDKAALVLTFVEALGIERHGTFRSEMENVDEDILLLGSEGNEVDMVLMQPLDPSRPPKAHIPPLNHIGVWVDNMEAAVDHLTRRGVRFTPGGIRKGAAGHDIAFIHPKGNAKAPLSGEGVLVELIRAPHP